MSIETIASTSPAAKTAALILAADSPEARITVSSELADSAPRPTSVPTRAANGNNRNARCGSVSSMYSKARGIVYSPLPTSPSSSTSATKVNKASSTQRVSSAPQMTCTAR